MMIHLWKTLEIHDKEIIIRSVFNDNNEYITHSHFRINVYTNQLYRYSIMLEYNRIDIFEGIDIKKANDFDECSFCLYYYLFYNEF